MSNLNDRDTRLKAPEEAVRQKSASSADANEREQRDARLKEWDRDTGNILTFTSLFALIVAAFAVESQKGLSPDITADLLTQILAANTDAPVPPSVPFKADTSVIVYNALWFGSLAISLLCALGANFMQQWSRDYARDYERKRHLVNDIRLPPALTSIFLDTGAQLYGMDVITDLLVASVHFSVMLFLGGLVLFMYTVDTTVAYCLIAVIGPVV
ncbi:unnamed protein product [Peniophora sp. CBMAI 1063]|nr:unnamed protein product [Peniophora sp. CBMAI 1063]